jgi:serine/threonine protein kinase
MATAYLAHDLVQGSRVALKLVQPELAPVLGHERFVREILILSHLHHPNILPVLDTGIADGLPFYVTPYVEGESLARLIHREGQLTIRQGVDIACEVPDALAVAHATTGVLSTNGSGFFPIEQNVVFEGSQSVAHPAYFGSRGVREKITEWLGSATQ